MSTTVIDSRDVHVWYGPFHALKGVTLPIVKHEITAFIGASGSGKSTFLRCFNRMIDTVSYARAEGEIQMNGNPNILTKDTDVIALRSKVGMVFQNPAPFPKSIYENVAYGLEIRGHKKPGGGLLQWGKRRTGEEIEWSKHPVDMAVVEALKDAALWDEVKHRLDLSAYRLSGGQQQRLCIARAIAVKPEILLLDEPCSELDPISTNHIEQTLLKLKTKYTIVIVTHNLHQARRISDHLAFFHAGELIEWGRTKDVFESPKLSLTRDYVAGNFG
ncbi:phosphate ABC transporter ATP-binding protein [Candidatus Peregrinibacteria bacterium]|nr:phosphate ABC transporter ATP-binding protein [Candidatus Peregrinibacteria bacterium]